MIEPDGHLHLACFPMLSAITRDWNLHERRYSPFHCQIHFQWFQPNPGMHVVYYWPSIVQRVPSGKNPNAILKFRYSFFRQVEICKTEELSDKVVRENLHRSGSALNRILSILPSKGALISVKKVQLCQCQIGPSLRLASPVWSPVPTPRWYSFRKRFGIEHIQLSSFTTACAFRHSGLKHRRHDPE